MRLLFFLILLATVKVEGQVVPVKIAGGSFVSIDITQHAWVYEDEGGALNIGQVVRQAHLFAPLKEYQQKKPGSVYWLKIPVTNAGSQACFAVLNFINISYVDIWLFRNDSAVLQKQAGIFQPVKNIAADDGRSFINLALAPQNAYSLYVKIRETKGFMPNLHLKLAERNAFFKGFYDRREIDVVLMGGLIILFIYIFISWLFSRFTPYIWLMVFSLGIGLYKFSLNGYLADWVMPSWPIFAWSCSSHFAHIGLAGAFLLLNGFLGFGGMNLRFYRLFKLFPALLLFTSLFMIATVYFFNSYRYSLYISTVVTAFAYPLVAYFLIKSWSRIEKEKRVFVFGVLMAIVLGISQNVLFFIFAEKAIALAALIAGSGLLVIMLFFLLSIKEGMRQRQKYKYNTLAELSHIRNQQNMELEEKVRERTAELDLRNQKIQTLMHEVQHRVKNNLQLLYSLNRMKMPNADDGSAKLVWQKNLVQIKAISLANTRMDGAEGQATLWLDEYIQHVVSHTSQIYDSEGRIRVSQRLQPSISVKINNAVSIGLILTELLANSYHHAFEGFSLESEIVIKLFSKDAKLNLVYYDNGKGFDEVYFKQKEGGGFLVIKDLARQLGVVVNLQHIVKEVPDMGGIPHQNKQDNSTIVFSFIFPASL